MTPRRWDIAVKWRFFRHLLEGNDPDAERLYRWHIEARSGKRMQAGLATDRWKTTLDDYVIAAGGVFVSIRDCGFLQSGAIPIDPDGELLDGSHRLACALALGLEVVPVTRQGHYVWAPAWGEDWFVANGCPAADLDRIRQDFHTLT